MYWLVKWIQYAFRILFGKSNGVSIALSSPVVLDEFQLLRPEDADKMFGSVKVGPYPSCFPHLLGSGKVMDLPAEPRGNMMQFLDSLQAPSREHYSIK